MLLPSLMGRVGMGSPRELVAPGRLGQEDDLEQLWQT